MDDVAAAPSGAQAAREPGPLRLGGREFPPERRLVMAIVNRTPDSFYRPGATWDEGAALERVHAAVAEGADIRAHDVRATRQALDMVAAIRGDLPPARAVRGLA
jgi:dihydropteroate synthase